MNWITASILCQAWLTQRLAFQSGGCLGPSGVNRDFSSRLPGCGKATFLEFRLAEMKAGEVRAGAAEPHPHREGLGRKHQRDTGTKRDILPGARAKPGQTQRWPY